MPTVLKFISPSFASLSLQSAFHLIPFDNTFQRCHSKLAKRSRLLSLDNLVSRRLRRFLLAIVCYFVLYRRDFAINRSALIHRGVAVFINPIIADMSIVQNIMSKKHFISVIGFSQQYSIFSE